MTRRALVTGGSRGIGHAIVDRLRLSGVEVFAPTRDELDLADPEAIDDFVARLEEPFDILVNNAGVNFPDPVVQYETAKWKQTLEVNLTAPFLLSRGLAPAMVDQGWGRIVNILSCYSFVSRGGRSAYTASKAGLLGFTRSLAIELAPHGVVVNGVAPGFVATEMTAKNNTADAIREIEAELPIGRLGRPAEIADAVNFLVGETSTYIVGHVITVDGGFLLQ